MDLPFRRGVAWSGLFLTLGLPCTDDRPAHSLQHRLIPYLQSHCVLHPSSSGLGPSSQSCSRTLTHTRSSGSSPSASHHTISSSLPTAPQHTISSHHRRPTTVHDNIPRTTISHMLPIEPITHSTEYLRTNLSADAVHACGLVTRCQQRRAVLPKATGTADLMDLCACVCMLPLCLLFHPYCTTHEPVIWVFHTGKARHQNQPSFDFDILIPRIMTSFT